MHLLQNTIRHYDWGSRSAIAALQGRPTPTDRPEAELWMGAHPSASSRVIRDGQPESLLEAVERAPDEMLGSAVVAAFGPRLPFLLKLLAAERSLSIQVHPTSEQATMGFAREEQEGVALDDPRRSYLDPYAKPELLCAVTEFDALCGFRDPITAADLLEQVRTPALDGVRRAVAEGRAGLSRTFATLVEATESSGLLLAEAERACREALERPLSPEHRIAVELVLRLADEFPGDAGAVGSLLLRRVLLAPGEAVYVPPGCPHAYLHGVGVEVMACSDNVIRGGLTSKFVDTAAFAAMTRSAETPVAPLLPETPARGIRRWRPPVSDFVLARCDLVEAGGEAVFTEEGPRILFAAAGTAEVVKEGEVTSLASGDALFVAATAGSLHVRGDAVLFQASVGQP
jgi:mannose-6-phosphate isomerase